MIRNLNTYHDFNKSHRTSRNLPNYSQNLQHWYAPIIKQQRRNQVCQESRIATLMREIKTVLQQILDTHNEICQAQTDMTTKFKELMDGHTLSPTPTQSALLNSRTGGGSSPAKKQEEHGQWDKRTSSASKESLPVWTTIAGYVIYQRGNVHFLLFPSTKSKRDALDLTKGTRIIDIINKRNSPSECDMKTFVVKANQKCRDCIIVSKLL
ncbi:hypothetical protein EMCRGX_G029093 [Ephydatia muelleri]